MAIDMAVYMRRRRFKRRKIFLKQLGSKCVNCGSKNKLEFDHIDNKTMSFRVSGDELDKPMDVLLKEIEKCQLLCRKCHLDKTAQELWGEYGHGTVNRYTSRRFLCRCRKCMDAYNEDRKTKRREYNKIRKGKGLKPV